MLLFTICTMNLPYKVLTVGTHNIMPVYAC